MESCAIELSDRRHGLTEFLQRCQLRLKLEAALLAVPQEPPQTTGTRTDSANVTPIMNRLPDVPQEPQAQELDRFNPQWDELEATLESLREHMQIIKDLQAQLSTAPAPAQGWQPIPDGIRYDKETDTYIAQHTILTAGRDRAEAKRALASAVKLTALHWPLRAPPSAPTAGEKQQ